MSGTGSFDTRIKPLGTRNYYHWQLRVKAVLKAKKCWRVVDPAAVETAADASSTGNPAAVETAAEESSGGGTPPAGRSAAPAARAAVDPGVDQEVEDLAWAIIALNVEDYHTATIYSCTTARELWMKLEGLYEMK